MSRRRLLREHSAMHWICYMRSERPPDSYADFPGLHPWLKPPKILTSRPQRLSPGTPLDCARCER